MTSKKKPCIRCKRRLVTAGNYYTYPDGRELAACNDCEAKRKAAYRQRHTAA